MCDKREISKPIVNSRPIVFCAIALALGILAGALLRNLPIVLCCLAVCAVVVTAVLGGLRKTCGAFIAGFALLGLVSFAVTFWSVDADPKTYSEAYVTGTVCEIKSSVSSVSSYILDDVTINGSNVGGKLLVYSEKEFALGNNIGFYGYGETFSFDPFDSYSASYYYYDIRHRFTAETAAVTGFGNVSIFSRIRDKIGSLYVEYMGERAGGMALGIVTGDKSMLDYEVTSAMRTSGLSHLTAVSGLHVGFMCSIVYFIFRLFKRSKRSSIFIVAVVLVLYGAITGFPPGVVRAAIMALTLLSALALGERYDPLNALGLAVIIILVLDPRELFSLSFLMSASAVLGIICFYRPLRKVLYKGNKKIVVKLVDAVAVSISANAYLVAVSACSFGTFSTYFLVSNPLAVAYTSVVYSVLVPVTLISFIPGLGVLLVPFKYLMLGLYTLASAIESLPGALLTVMSNIASAVCYSASLVVVSRFVRLRPKVKIPVACALLLLSILLLYVI